MKVDRRLDPQRVPETLNANLEHPDSVVGTCGVAVVDVRDRRNKDAPQVFFNIPAICKLLRTKSSRNLSPDWSKSEGAPFLESFEPFTRTIREFLGYRWVEQSGRIGSC